MRCLAVNLKSVAVKKQQIVMLRKVARSGNYYLITLPKKIGEKLHRKTVQITIEVLEELGETS